MLISSVTPTELFVSSPSGPAQVLEVSLGDPAPGATVTVRVDGTVVGQAPATDGRIEVPLTRLVGAEPGTVVDAEVSAGPERERVSIPIAEPGWTVWMIPHFHYDPVWWNTQAAYTCTWDDLGDEAQRTRM